MLNDQPAKLFRSGTLTVLDLLMMNGYNSADLVGRTGKSLSVTVDGQRMTFRGQSATPCVLRLNGPPPWCTPGTASSLSPLSRGIPPPGRCGNCWEWTSPAACWSTASLWGWSMS
jgi:hypothetical protein